MKLHSNGLQVSGRIVIDVFAFRKFNPGAAAPVIPLEQDKSDASGGIEPTNRLSLEDTLREERPSLDQQKGNVGIVQGNLKYLLMVSPLLAGYSLNTRK